MFPQILYGSQGLAVSSRLKKGTPLRVPVKGTHEPGKRVENSLGGTSYVSPTSKFPRVPFSVSHSPLAHGG